MQAVMCVLPGAQVPAGAAAAEPTTGDAQEEAAAMVQDPPSPVRPLKSAL